VTRTFDQLNRLTNIYLNGAIASAASFGYDQLSRRVSLALGNAVEIGYTYALNDDLVELAQSFVGSSNTYQYSYNNVHELIGWLYRPGRFQPLYLCSKQSIEIYGSLGFGWRRLGFDCNCPSLGTLDPDFVLPISLVCHQWLPQSNCH
jgi:hypothetical protein